LPNKMKTIEEIFALYEDLPEFYGQKLTDVNDHGTFRDTPLHTAVWRKSLEEVNVLLLHGADPNSVGERGDRPLHAAVSGKHEAIIEALLRAGANVDSKNDEGSDVWKTAEIVGYKDELEKIVMRVSMTKPI
jgi:ankyrin repeat protein